MPKPRSSKSTLFQVLNSAHCPLYILDAEGKIIFANEPLCHWLGLDFDQIQSAKCLPSIEATQQPLEDSLRGLAIPPSAYQEVYSNGKVFRTAADRHLIWRAASFVRLSGNRDTPGHVLVVLDDSDQDATSIPETPEPWLRQLIVTLKSAQFESPHLDRFIGTSPAAHRLNEQIQLACNSQSNLLITGPLGAGTKALGNFIHQKRHEKTLLPITEIQCSVADAQSIQKAIVYVQRQRGPKRAGDWFMLLDPENMSQEAVNELHGFLQLPRNNLNFISISTQPQKIDPRLTDFLNIIHVDVPALRVRKTDIPILASHFLKRHSQNDLAEFNKAAQQLLTDYDWPNDITEMEETIAEVAKGLRDTAVSPKQLPERFHYAIQAQQIGAESIPTIDLENYLASIEAELIERALNQTKHNKAKACKLLGISRAKLGRRIQVLGIGSDDSEPIIFEESHDNE